MNNDLNKKFNEILNNIDTANKPNLFLHSCCGPCSSSVLDRLTKYFNIYIIFFNPNIDTKEEFNKRLSELKKLLNIAFPDIRVIYEDYDHKMFLDYISGHENDVEGGCRCELCFKLRLSHAYDLASAFINNNSLNDDVNYLCTTLSVSPHKDAIKIYDIGAELCNQSKIQYLPSDFKKEDGYLKSIIFSKKYSLYRQNYCGCEFSK